MSRSCKKTHRKVSGECVPNNVVNKKLYASIKKKISRRVKRKGQRWGAYTSGNLVQEYKRKGGKYSGRKKSYTKKKRKRKTKSKRKSRKKKKKSKRKRKTKRKRKSRRRKHRVTPVSSRQFRKITNVARRSPNIIKKAGKPVFRNITTKPKNVENLD